MVLKGSIYRIGLVILFLPAIFTSAARAQDHTSPHKRVGKAIQKLWGENLEIVPLSQDEAPVPDSGFLPGKDRFFHIRENGDLRGYLITSSAKGRYDEFDYSVIFNDDAVVLQVLVTVYRSTHGAAICQKNWLRQFEGYEGGRLELGKDIDAVSGGTLSATSLVKDIHRLHLLLSSQIVEKAP